MLKKDIRFLSELGYSLWSDPESAQSLVRDTVSTIAFAEKDSLVASEKAVRALLTQAEKRGMIVQPRLAQPLLQPGAIASQDPIGAFQYLFAEERVILLALHSGKWSYERIARVVGESVDSLQSIAWSARVHLAFSQRYPAGSKPVSVSCPEYDSRKPWTQKYLDDEYRGEEKLFLSDHLVGCQSCREALVRAKEVFFQVDAMVAEISRISERKAERSGLTLQLTHWVDQGQRFRKPPPPTTQELAIRFFTRWDIALVCLAWIVWMFLKK
jgi:hypothetical protein